MLRNNRSYSIEFSAGKVTPIAGSSSLTRQGMSLVSKVVSLAIRKLRSSKP